MRRPNRQSLAAAVMGLLAVCAVAYLVRYVIDGIDLFGGRGVLLETREGPTRIWLADNGSFDLALELHVDGPAGQRSLHAIDKSSYGTLRFIRYGGKIFAANGPFLFAAYDPSADRVIEHDELPFTIWEGQGEVVDSYRFSSDPPHMPPRFPQVREHRAGRR